MQTRQIPIVILSLFLICSSCNPTSETENTVTPTSIEKIAVKSIMVIFAHPDDESTVAPVLARYVREGIAVHLVIATDGRLGVNDFSGLEAGDGLAEIRKREMQCAAEALGVHLIHLNYHDQLKAGEGYDGHMPHAQALIKELHQLVSEIKPDVLITFGPDGGSNHMDHRLIGATATAVFLNKNWEQPHSLYFVSTPSSLIENESSRILRGVADHYITNQVSYTDEDFAKAVASMMCHESQFQTKGLKERMEQRRAARESKIYFRKFVASTGSSTSLFE